MARHILTILWLIPSLISAAALPHYDFALDRRSDNCGGDTSLTPCGGSFPSDFCCPHLSTCLPLNATGAIATVCCPPGVDCSKIQPTTCEQGAYNATSSAANQVHVSPIRPLATCGSACCPAGYECQNGKTCSAILTANNVTSAPSPTQSLALAASTTSAAVPAVSDSVAAGQTPTDNATFSGPSFAAGFVPGIVLGMGLVVLLLCCLKRRKQSISYQNKNYSHDQLTNLGLSNQPRANTHTRSISEPTILQNGGYRSEFLRTIAPADGQRHGDSFETIEEEKESQDQQYQPRPMFEFSPSPPQPRSPIPAHLKRGTLSYHISPIRQLRSKKSIHSLRRHAASPKRSNSSGQRSSITRSNTSASTETIQVLMTPDQRPSYVAPSESDQSRERIPSSIYQSQTWTTPSRIPNNPQPGVLGSPYAYQPKDSTSLEASGPSRSRRVTTFSSLMEKAGLRKEDLLGHS